MFKISSACCSLVGKWSLTLYYPMDCSAPGLPVLYDLPEFAQTYAHWVGDAIQTSHPLSSSSQPALNLSLHQGLFQWVSSSHQVTKVLEHQHQSFEWVFKTDFLQDWLAWSPYSPGDPQESSSTPQFESINFSALNLPYNLTLTSVCDCRCGKTIALTIHIFVGKAMSLLFNMLFSFVMAFLPKSKCLLILWLQSLSAVILEPKNIKPDTVAIFSPSICLRWQQLGTKKGVTKNLKVKNGEWDQ